MPGLGHNKAWWHQYEAVKKAGYSKESAARITNASQKKRKRKRGKR